MIDIFSLTTNKLVEKLKEGEISSVEVCTQYIERIEKFEFSRKVCKTHISNYRNCVQQHGSHKMTNDNPCLNAWIMQNCCTGRVICPAAAEKAEQNTSGSHGELADCQQQFMTRLKADIAASKSR